MQCESFLWKSRKRLQGLRLRPTPGGSAQAWLGASNAWSTATLRSHATSVPLNGTTSPQPTEKLGQALEARSNASAACPTCAGTLMEKQAKACPLDQVAEDVTQLLHSFAVSHLGMLDLRPAPESRLGVLNRRTLVIQQVTIGSKRSARVHLSTSPMRQRTPWLSAEALAWGTGV